MDISFFKIFMIMGLVSSWAERSLEDGKITIQETVDLAEGVAQILGIVLEVDFGPSREEKPVAGNAELLSPEPPSDDQPERYSHLKEVLPDEAATEELATEKDERGP